MRLVNRFTELSPSLDSSASLALDFFGDDSLVAALLSIGAVAVAVAAAALTGNASLAGAGDFVVTASVTAFCLGADGESSSDFDGGTSTQSKSTEFLIFCLS